MHYYLLVFMINVGNLQPVTTKDCVKISANKAKQVFAREVAKLLNSGFTCDRFEDNMAQNCISSKSGVLAKVILMRDLVECRATPRKTVKALGVLVGQ